MKQAKTFIHPTNKLEILRRRIAARTQKSSEGCPLSSSLPINAPAAGKRVVNAQGSV